MKFPLPLDTKYDVRKDVRIGIDIFCAKCLTHENHFRSGGSWAPDLCPCGCEDTIVWYNMSPMQKLIAQYIYDGNEKKKRYELD